MVYRRDALKIAARHRITDDDPYFRRLREQWGAALKDAYRKIERPDWIA
jgi:putative proteasome-type protease